MSDLDAVIDRLLKERERLGLSQQHVAEATGISQPLLSAFENRKSAPPIGKLAAWARALDHELIVDLRARGDGESDG